YVLKYLEDGYEVKDECEEYFHLNISPHHIHRTKAEHKYAIFVLSESISDLLAKRNNLSTPSNVSNGLSELAKRSKKELIRMHEDNVLKYQKNENVEII
ncbi:MAG: UPF0058 family protein, partial [Methanobacterium sp.]